jgi:hypothetical protein
MRCDTRSDIRDTNIFIFISICYQTNSLGIDVAMQGRRKTVSIFIRRRISYADHVERKTDNYDRR